MAGKKGLKKRVWSDDEKRTICTQTLTPGVSVAQVARRYSMNANLIFKWLKDPRFAPEEGGSSPEESIALEGVFLPVEIETPGLERPMTLLLFDGAGEMQNILRGPNKRDFLRAQFNAHLARYTGA